MTQVLMYGLSHCSMIFCPRADSNRKETQWGKVTSSMEAAAAATAWDDPAAAAPDKAKLSVALLLSLLVLLALMLSILEAACFCSRN